jgi:hypothetical protein
VVTEVNPGVAPVITGNTSFCEGDSVQLRSSIATGNLWSNGATTEFINVRQAGIFTVRQVVGNCTSAISTPVTITQISRPSTPGILGNTSICVGESTILTSTASTGNVWSNGATTNSIAITTPGTYTLRASNGGCLSNPATVTVTERILPVPTIAGSLFYCLGGNTVLTSSAVSGNIWSNGATSQSITVNAAGNYAVKYIMDACTSAFSTIAVVAERPTPAVPLVTASLTNLQANDSCVLTVQNPVPNAVYRWNTGQSGTRIVIRTTDTVSVTAELLGCYSQPSTPIIITGSRKTVKVSSISVYPNPTKGILNINTAAAIIGSISIEDIGGKSVLKSEGVLNNVLDLSALPNGIYYLKIVNAERVFVQKVIKQ